MSDQQRDAFDLTRRGKEDLPQESCGPHHDQLKMQRSSPRTLLQVENNLANAELVEQLIARRTDLKLLTAIDAYKGIAMACLYQPDVILMDMKMPGIDGRGALRILRENPVTARIPVIAISSNAYKLEIQQCLDAGFFCYVTKPYRIDELLGLIDLALHHAAEQITQAPGPQSMQCSVTSEPMCS